jgi:hypothetical protein
VQIVTKKQLKDKLNYLKVVKAKLEGENLMVKKMLIYQSLPEGEKERIEEAWNKYFDLVRESKSYKRYCEQRDAYKRGDMAIVKNLSLEAREEMANKTDWIPKPSSVNPANFGGNGDCQRYWGILKAIGIIKKELLESGDEEALTEEIFAS